MGEWNDGFEPDDYNQDDALWIEQSNARARTYNRLVNETGDSDMSGTAAELRALIEQAQAELARLEARPAEPFADVAVTIVVLFRFRYDGRGKIYTFAAVRTDTKWYVTGNGAPGRGITWSALWEWIEGQGKLVGPMQIASNWDEL
jgi:hypothetical protein